MTKNFNQFIDLNKRIGKILILGKEGTGKTLLLTAIAVQKMLHGMQDCWSSYEKVDEYNRLGYDFEKNYEHLCFANLKINCSGTKIPSRISYPLNPYKLGLFCEDYDTDFYPPGTCYFITESQRVFNSYMFEYVRPEVWTHWQTSRQAGLSLVMDAQRLMTIAVNLRDLVNRFIFLTKEVTHIKKDNIVVGHIFHIVEFSDSKDAEIYDKTGKINNGEEYDLQLNKCYFDNYDSYFCRYMHLKGRYGQSFSIRSWNNIQSVEDIEELEDLLGVNIPEGYYVKKSDIKKAKAREGPQFASEIAETTNSLDTAFIF